MSFPIFSLGFAGSAKFWKFEFFVTATTQVAVNEMEFRESVGGADVSSAATKTASTESLSDTVDKAFDGDTGTQWICALNDPRPSIKFQFASNRTLAQFALRGYTTATMPQATRILTSDDDVTYREVGWVYTYAASIALRSYAIPAFIQAGTPVGATTRWGFCFYGTYSGQAVWAESAYFEAGVNKDGLRTADFGPSVTAGSLANLFDGSGGTWCQFQAPMADAIHHDFSAAILVDRLDLQAHASLPSRCPRDFHVVAWDVSSGWGRSVHEEAGLSWTSGETKSFSW